MQSDLERRFRELGGRFVIPAERMAARLAKIRGLVFDWDGVFNAGVKGTQVSGFSEPDSMGTNMLRFAMWLEQEKLPFCAIVSGADNPAAREFAKRECFNDVFCGIRDKSRAFAAFAKAHGLKRSELAYVFDDINDLGIAETCGLRVLVRRDASPLFTEYATRHALCDYVTGRESGDYAVREVCELMIGLLDRYETVVAARSAVDARYETYFADRQAIATECHDAA